MSSFKSGIIRNTNNNSSSLEKDKYYGDFIDANTGSTPLMPSKKSPNPFLRDMGESDGSERDTQEEWKPNEAVEKSVAAR